MPPLRLAPLLFCLLVCLPASAARGQEAAPLSPRQLAKAEELLSSLDRLSAPAARGQAGAARVRERAAAVRDSARALPEGDVRTDIETAARLIESATAAPEGARPDCAGERPGAYRRLCTESGAADELLLRKAGLHAAWARASVRRARGAAGAQELEALEAAAAERRLERSLAESALESLRQLERLVVVYRTLADFEEGGTLSRVPFGSFEGRFEQTAGRVLLILGWLPETRLRSELRNALRSYADGRFRWSKVHCARVVEAGRDCATEFDRWRLGAARPNAYAVAVNWRNASEHLDRAAQLLGRQTQLLTHNIAAPGAGAATPALLFKP
ncbi:MAG TPA: hypothetical protein VG148_11255 [Pyrinomonadaceae bacterium]|nr:hypothetical protein [Pyrinomonadaceae bacterium]